MTKPIIEVRNLSKRYQLGSIGTTSLREESSRLWDRLRGVPHPDRQEFWALRDVSFDILPGEVIGLVGRNGAGKSTLLKILSRITEPTSGHVRLRGRVASLLEVGTGFHPELTGRENVYLNGAILGMTRAEVARKFDQIVAFAEVDQFIDTPVKRYSSGMYVRLAFAVAAHLDPEILVVDEVLAVGDTAFQKKCLDRMQSIAADEHRTVILVSHNLNAVVQLCTRAIFLNAGRLGAVGPPSEVIRNYFGTPNSVEPTIDLAGRSRSGHLLARARFGSVRMVGSVDAHAWKVPFEDDVILEFELTVRETVKQLELGTSFFNLQGVEICSSLSSWSGKIGPTKPGNYRLTARFPSLRLLPRTYRVGIGLRSERDMEDYLGEAFDLEIINSTRTKRENLATVHGAVAVDVVTELTAL